MKQNESLCTRPILNKCECVDADIWKYGGVGGVSVSAAKQHAVLPYLTSKLLPAPTVFECAFSLLCFRPFDACSQNKRTITFGR